MKAPIWKPVPGFHGYEVSDAGEVRSWKRGGHVPLSSPKHGGWWLIRRPSFHGGGYPLVTLRRDGRTFIRYVHGLVLLAFKGPAPDGMECLHRDGDPKNNALANLRWGTAKENAADRDNHGRTVRGARWRAAHEGGDR